MQKFFPFILGTSFIGLPIIAYFYSGEYDEYAIGIMAATISAILFFSKQEKISISELMFIVFWGYSIVNTLIRGYPISSGHCLILLLVIVSYCLGKSYSSDRQICLWMIIIVALFHSILIILQYAGILTSLSYYFKVSSVYGNPAPPAIIIVLGFVALLYLKKEQVKAKGAYFTMSAIMIAAVLISSSRTAVLSLVACCLYELSVRKWKKEIVAYAVGGIILLLPCFYFIRPGSADVRLLIWRASLGMVQENPCFGSGIGSFASDYMLYQARYFSLNPDSRFVMFATNHNQAYNEFLRILCEEGVIGLVMFIFPVIWMLKRSGNLLPLFMVSAISSSFLYTADIIVWVCELALLTGLMQKEDSKSIEIKPYLHRSISFSIVIAVILFLMHPIPSRPSSCYEDTLRCGLTAQKEGDYDEAEEQFMLAFHMIPCRITAPYLLFNLYRETDEKKAVLMAESIVSFGEYKNEGNATLRMKNEVNTWLRNLPETTDAVTIKGDF